MTIVEMQREAWECAEEKGFHNGRGPTRDDSLIRLALIHTEVSEATQIVKRHGVDAADGSEHLEAIGEELADVMIRLGDFAECLGIELQYHVRKKIDANRQRPHLYGTPAGKGPGC